MLSRCESNRALSHDDGFEIGLHHPLDSALPRDLSQFIQFELLAAPRVRERLQERHDKRFFNFTEAQDVVGSASLGGFTTLTDDDVDGIVAYLQLLGPARTDR